MPDEDEIYYKALYEEHQADSSKWLISIYFSEFTEEEEYIYYLEKPIPKERGKLITTRIGMPCLLEYDRIRVGYSSMKCIDIDAKPDGTWMVRKHARELWHRLVKDGFIEKIVIEDY